MDRIEDVGKGKGEKGECVSESGGLVRRFFWRYGAGEKVVVLEMPSRRVGGNTMAALGFESQM